MGMRKTRGVGLLLILGVVMGMAVFCLAEARADSGTCTSCCSDCVGSILTEGSTNLTGVVSNDVAPQTTGANCLISTTYNGSCNWGFFCASPKVNAATVKTNQESGGQIAMTYAITFNDGQTNVTLNYAGAGESGPYSLQSPLVLPNGKTVTAKTLEVGSCNLFGANGYLLSSDGTTTTVTRQGVPVRSITVDSLGQAVAGWHDNVSWTQTNNGPAIPGGNQHRVSFVEETVNFYPVKKTYYHYSPYQWPCKKMRVTEVGYNSDGSSRFLTTIYGFDTDGNVAMVVDPEGVKRYLVDKGLDSGINLSDPSQTCSLDDISTTGTNGIDTALQSYATRLCEYDDLGRLTYDHGRACCGATGQGMRFSYSNSNVNAHANPNYPANPTDNDNWNTWSNYTLILPVDAAGNATTSAAWKVQFTNTYGQVICQVTQSMNSDGTSIVSKSIEHLKRYYTAAEDGSDSYRAGLVQEHRHPSACVNYTIPEVNVTTSGQFNGRWVSDFTASDSETTGLVDTYDYNQNAQQLWHKVRKGTGASDEYYLTQTIYGTDPGSGCVTTSYGSVPYTVYRPYQELAYVAATTDSTNSAAFVTTTHAYTYYTDSAGANTQTVSQETITRQAVATAHNGSNASTSEVRHYYQYTAPSGSQTLYYNDWTQFSDSTYFFTKQGQGAVDWGQTVASVQDADTNINPNLPSGWSARTGTLNLTTSYTYYNSTFTDHAFIGALQSSRDPAGKTAYYAYMSQTQQTGANGATVALVNLSTASMSNASTYSPVPVQINVTDLAGRTVLAATGISAADAGGTLTNDPASAFYTQSGGVSLLVQNFSGTLCTLQRACYDLNGHATERDAFRNIPTSGDGVAGTDYYPTVYAYDVLGRQQMTTAPDGTTTWTEYDALSRTTQTWMGTNSYGAVAGSPNGTGSPNNMQKISVAFYDEATPGSGTSGVGDGTLTSTRAYYDASNYYTSTASYDWRDRHVQSCGPDGVTTASVLDNLGRAVTVTTSAGGVLYGRTDTAYDERGQTYATTVYSVSNGTVGHSLTTSYWYDAVGRRIKTANANGLFQKTVFDGAGRPTDSYVCFNPAGETGYSAAASVAGNIVIEQSDQTLDAVGQTVSSTHFQRNDNDTTTTGSLTTTIARPRYAGAWYDALGRPVRTADYGTTVGATFIATTTSYNPAGLPSDVGDNMNRVTHREFDALGHTVKVVENYCTSTGSDCNRTTSTQYDDCGRLASLAAWTSATSSAGAQITSYGFASPLSASLQTSVTYPDGGSVTCTYDYLGRKTSYTDQNGTVHQYTFDSAARFKMDAVMTAGTGIDTTVRAISRTYDAAGRPVGVTSWANADGTAAVNDVAVTYDGWNHVVASQQEHNGAVGGSTPAVSYTYDDGATGNVAKYSRMIEVVYPSGQQVWYNYPGSGTVGGALSRTGSIAADSGNGTVYAGYTYLGAGTVVQVVHPQVAGGLVLSYGTGGNYTGWDQFGRVVAQDWTTNAGGVLDKYTYGYDNNSNRTYRKNLSTTGLDELYGYDNLNRLTSLQRGTLSADHSSISSQLNAEGFGPDFLGNMSSYTVSTGGSLFLNQSRTVNPANEITGITTGYGTAWATPSYDANGNMTIMPRPGNESSSLTVIYDAWNRQVSVSNSAGLVENYSFDGLNHRIAKAVPNGSNWTRTDFYYNQKWQVLEERQTLSQTSSTTVATVAYCVTVWDLRYIDAPVCRSRSTTHNGALDETLYYCNDANFNTTTVVSLTGAVLERYSYDAYGKPTFYNGSWIVLSNGSAYDNQILFCGYRYDLETGLYHVRNRMYNPSLGAWSVRDPAGYVDGLSLYGYVRGRPVSRRDHRGLSDDIISSSSPGMVNFNQPPPIQWILSPPPAPPAGPTIGPPRAPNPAIPPTARETAVKKIQDEHPDVTDAQATADNAAASAAALTTAKAQKDNLVAEGCKTGDLADTDLKKLDTIYMNEAVSAENAKYSDMSHSDAGSPALYFVVVYRQDTRPVEGHAWASSNQCCRKDKSGSWAWVEVPISVGFNVIGDTVTGNWKRTDPMDMGGHSLPHPHEDDVPPEE